MMETKSCPDCNKSIAVTATRCRCGWKEHAATQTRPHVDCCFEGCGKSAIVKERTKTGWANVCYDHMMKLANDSAKEYCANLGLYTPEDCRQWLRKNKLTVKRAPVREPGEDTDEEIGV